MLGELDCLEQGLAEVGERGSRLGLDVALDDAGEEAGEGGTKIGGGEVMAGEEIGDVVANFVGGAGLGFLAGMEVAEMRMSGAVRGAAVAAVGEGEGTEAGAVFWTRERRTV